MLRHDELNRNLMSDENVEQTNRIWRARRTCNCQNPRSCQRPLRFGVGDFLGWRTGIPGAGLPGMPPLGKQPPSEFGLRTGHGMWEGGFGNPLSTFFRGNGLFPPGTKNALITVYLLELQEKQ